MFIDPTSYMRAFSALCFVSLQVGVFLTTPIQLVVAQPFPSQGQSPRQPPSPVPGTETEVIPTGANDETSQPTQPLPLRARRYNWRCTSASSWRHTA